MSGAAPGVANKPGVGAGNVGAGNVGAGTPPITQALAISPARTKVGICEKVPFKLQTMQGGAVGASWTSSPSGVGSIDANSGVYSAPTAPLASSSTVSVVAASTNPTATHTQKFLTGMLAYPGTSEVLVTGALPAGRSLFDTLTPNRAMAGRGQRVYAITSETDSTPHLHIWRSDDSGATFYRIDATHPSGQSAGAMAGEIPVPANYSWGSGTVQYKSFAIAVDAANPDIAYVGYGLPFASNSRPKCMNGNDIYQYAAVSYTTDGGVTWSQPRAAAALCGSGAGFSVDIVSTVGNSASFLYQPSQVSLGAITTFDITSTNMPQILSTGTGANTCQRGIVPGIDGCGDAIVKFTTDNAKDTYSFRLATKGGAAGKGCLSYSSTGNSTSKVWVECGLLADGSNWSATAPLADGVVGNNVHPMIAFSPDGAKGGVVWHNQRGQASPYGDVTLAIIDATTGTKTSGPAVLNARSPATAPLTASNDPGQRPDIRVDASGFMWIAWATTLNGVVVNKSCDWNSAGAAAGAITVLPYGINPVLLTDVSPPLIARLRATAPASNPGYYTSITLEQY